MTTNTKTTPGMPDTAMAAAFLVALARWAERHASTDKITLPTGIVAASELARVLRAIGLLDRRPS
jgi:hypothetical protein